MWIAATHPDWRRRLYTQLEPSAWPNKGLSVTNKLVAAIILFSALMAILETEPRALGEQKRFLIGLEWAFTLIFAVEYIARVWVSAENPAYGPGIRGMLRYIRSPVAILDLLALTPVLLTLGGSEAFLLRLFRLLRIMRLARLGRFSTAMRLIGEAVSSRRYELILSTCVALLLLVISSALLYMAEGAAQPEAFGSIPRAMWWSIATLTTVGYGDVYPVTAVGRVLAALTAVTGIGLIAMPTGILAAAFSDVMQRQNTGTPIVDK